MRLPLQATASQQCHAFTSQELGCCVRQLLTLPDSRALLRCGPQTAQSAGGGGGGAHLPHPLPTRGGGRRLGLSLREILSFLRRKKKENFPPPKCGAWRSPNKVHSPPLAGQCHWKECQPLPQVAAGLMLLFNAGACHLGRKKQKMWKCS